MEAGFGDPSFATVPVEALAEAREAVTCEAIDRKSLHAVRNERPANWSRDRNEQLLIVDQISSLLKKREALIGDGGIASAFEQSIEFRVANECRFAPELTDEPGRGTRRRNGVQECKVGLRTG